MYIKSLILYTYKEGGKVLRGVDIEGNPHITRVITAFRKEFGPDFRFRGESHDFWELVCVIKGHISVAADSRIFELKKGQAILHTPMQFHNITALGYDNSEIAVFTFTGENIPEIGNQVCEIQDISKVKQLAESARKNYNFDNSICITEPLDESGNHLVYAKRLELFLLELALGLGYEGQTVSQRAKNYSIIVNTLNANVERRLTVGQLAKECNMSSINLQKTFSYYAGIGVMEYFNRIKMNRAAEYLKGGLSVKETAHILGFEDQNYFSTVFKRITGHAPTDFGRKLSAEEGKRVYNSYR